MRLVPLSFDRSLMYMRLVLIGVVMGIADVIPGISGGTIAFLSGIYEDLLLSLQSLQLHAPSRVNWRFLLPLGVGMSTGFLACAHFIYSLLIHPLYDCYLYALFFGLIAASTWLCGKRAEIKTLPRWILFAGGACLAFFLSSTSASVQGPFHPFYLVLAGSLAAGAMLLPGISGSYVLCLMGIYPLAIAGFASLSEGWKILLPLVIGIALGVMGFSRLIHFLIKHFRSLTLSLLTGFMAGGLRSMWPFAGRHLFLILLIMLVGILGVFLLEILTKRIGMRYNKKNI